MDIHVPRFLRGLFLFGDERLPAPPPSGPLTEAERRLAMRVIFGFEHYWLSSEERALDFLLKHLSRRQVEELVLPTPPLIGLDGCDWLDRSGHYIKRRHAFTVRVKSGRHYRIYWGTHINVVVFDESMTPLASICSYCPMDVPVPDLMLAQKLMLDTDETLFLRTGHAQYVWDPRFRYDILRNQI